MGRRKEARVVVPKLDKRERSLLCQQLGSPTTEARRLAIEQLGAQGAHAEDNADALLSHFAAEKKLTLQRALLEALAKIAPGHGGVQALLLAQAHSSNLVLREEALRRLGHFPAPAPAAVASLIEALEEKHASLRLAAAQALLQLTPHVQDAIPTIQRILPQQTPEVKVLLKHLLTRLGLKELPRLPALCANLQQGNSSQRKRAAQALGPLALYAQGAAAALEEALQDPSPKTRLAVLEAIQTLAQHCSFSHRLHTQLRAQFSGPGVHIRTRILQVVRALRVWSKDVVCLLQEGLQDASWQVRWASAHALTRMQVEDTEQSADLLQALEAALEDVRPCVREVAVSALAHQRGPDASVLPRVLALQHDPDGAVRQAARQASGKIIPPLQRGLQHTLQDGAAHLRQASMQLLPLAPPSEDAQATLEEALHGAHPRTSRQAANTLGRIGVDASTATPALLQHTRTRSHPNDRRESAHALNAVAPQQAVASLLQTLKAPDHPPAHQRAIEALGSLPPTPALLHRLAEVARVASGDLLDTTLHTLARIGPSASSTTDTLSALLQSPLPLETSRAILFALKRIGNTTPQSMSALLDQSAQAPHPLRPLYTDTLQTLAPAVAQTLVDTDPSVRNKDNISLLAALKPHLLQALRARLEANRRDSLRLQRFACRIATTILKPRAHTVLHQACLDAIAQKERSLHAPDAPAPPPRSIFWKLSEEAMDAETTTHPKTFLYLERTQTTVQTLCFDDLAELAQRQALLYASRLPLPLPAPKDRWEALRKAPTDLDWEALWLTAEALQEAPLAAAWDTAQAASDLAPPLEIPTPTSPTAQDAAQATQIHRMLAIF